MSPMFRRLYYKIWNRLLSSEPIPLPGGLDGKKNLIIYFDYEREFGGEGGRLSDENILELLNLLEKFQIKSTWFTVGQIFEQYPDSLSRILKSGHEVASHTFDHVIPMETSNKKLEDDFLKFDVAKEAFDIKGFHAPQSSWSVKMLHCLVRHHYSYDLIYDQRNNFSGIRRVNLGHQKSLIRIRTVGDDWPLFKKGNKPEMVFEYYIGLTEKIKKGELGAIGFHPWIICSDHSIFDGFTKFLEAIDTGDFFHSESAIHYVSLVENQHKNENQQL